MINELSILIPVYNDSAVALVSVLHSQAEAIDGLEYEILAIDDGSTNEAVIAENRAIDGLSHCRYVIDRHHDCRAAMRNNMTSKGKYEWHLMVDARLSLVYDDFLLRYLRSGAQRGEAVCGGVCVDGGADSARLYKENLRFRYEKFEEKNHSVEVRNRLPYNSFRTTNFFYHRSVLERVPYDERIKGYGYEDVMLGRAFRNSGIVVRHIDNPVAYTCFEGNAAYLKKIEEAMLTLHQFAGELKDYSPLLGMVGRLRSMHMLWLVRLFHWLFSGAELRNLKGNKPSLTVFKLYKLGFFACI
ncbi:MAG: glycosyltransferase family 2 protein [Prevotella sp.]|uniref:glycosyltransferase family 2 protein n=1 Tax=Prevotella sp. TaxID=59823 RepID=UPI00257CEF9E|nr:glycosyltransferase family 2 protein [Prevotella sp.]MBS5875683.1 glycosyltransferase family 2 protein [Prevotella sp.]